MPRLCRLAEVMQDTRAAAMILDLPASATPLCERRFTSCLVEVALPAPLTLVFSVILYALSSSCSSARSAGLRTDPRLTSRSFLAITDWP